MKFAVHCQIRKRVLSVRPLEGASKGRVVAHVEQVQMRDVTFKVSEAGRVRVVTTKRKNVHAVVAGRIEAVWGAEIKGDPDNDTRLALCTGQPLHPLSATREKVVYDPYKNKNFTRERDGKAVRAAAKVHLDCCGIKASGIVTV